MTHLSFWVNYTFKALTICTVCSDGRQRIAFGNFYLLFISFLLNLTFTSNLQLTTQSKYVHHTVPICNASALYISFKIQYIDYRAQRMWVPSAILLSKCQHSRWKRKRQSKREREAQKGGGCALRIEYVKMNVGH